MMDKAKKSFVINVLRRGTYRWPGRWKAEKRSHLPEEKRYYCEECGLVCRKKDTQMDHILPVIPVEKSTETTTLDEIAERMYPFTEGWQRLCKECHKVKTDAENAQRREPVSKPRAKKKKKS